MPRRCAGARKATAEVLAAAAAAETQARAAERAAQRMADEARERHAASEKRQAQIASRLAGLETGKARALSDRDEAIARRDGAAEALEELDEPAFLSGTLDAARMNAAECRAAAAEARAAHERVAREAEARARRRADIARERGSWIQRREKASDGVAGFESRQADTQAEAEALAEAPAELRLKRLAVIGELEDAESARKHAADARAAAEMRLADTDRAARETVEAMSAAREAAARAEARVEGARQRLADALENIRNALDCEPADLYAIAEIKPGDEFPPATQVAGKLEALKADRERIGPVNLVAADELAQAEASRDRMAAERDDLTEAIRKLRGAIGSLNKEGRERLIGAFDVVNGHFRELFTLLFGGGTAETAAHRERRSA